MALPLLLVLLQAATPVANTRPAQKPAPTTAPAGSVPAWTTHFNGDIRWQQVTPAGALLVSTDGALAGVDIERGQISWQKPELGGLPVDSVRAIESSLLMEAAKPGLSLIFDPVTGTVLFDSRKLTLTKVVTRRVLPQSGTLLVHGQRASGPPLVALYDLGTGAQRWVSESLFQQAGPKKGGFGGLMQSVVRAAASATNLEVLQAGPDVIVVYTLMGLRALDAKTGAIRWNASLQMARSGTFPHKVHLYQSVAKPDRIYVSYDERLMAYRLVDGQPLWAKPATVNGWIRDIIQHPAGIVMLTEGPPPDQATGNVRIVNGVVQTGLNVARYDDGSTIAPKPVKMRGDVVNALIAGDAVVLAVDADSKTYINVLTVATATLRLEKDVKIKGLLDYAELAPAGLLYISRSDAATNGEVNVIDLTTGAPKYKDAIEGGKNSRLLHAVEGSTLYVYANKDRHVYAVNRQDGSFRALGPEIKLQGNEDPTALELRPAGIVLTSSQNLVVVGRDGALKQQAYHPAPQLPGLLRALYRVQSVRAGLYGAAASAYGDAFAQAARQSSDTTAKYVYNQLSTAYTQGGAQLQGYSSQASALASKRFKATLTAPSSVFMLTRAPEGNGNVLLQIDKDSGQPRARVSLGKEREPVYAVDDIAGMLFLQTTAGTLVGYRL